MVRRPASGGGLGTSVTGLDTARQQLRLADGTSLTYANLVLATGSRPSPLPIPGGEDPDLIYVRDLASGHRLRGLSGSAGGRVAVIGSGFIGCEAAASVAMNGVQVVLVSAEALPQGERLGAPTPGGRSPAGCRPPASARRSAHRWPRSAGVTATSSWKLTDGAALRVREVIAAGGAHPAVELAERSGLTLEQGGVQVDASLRTSAPHVFAVGDIAFAEHPAAGRHLRVEHWGDAEQHGTVAGTVAAGGHSPLGGSRRGSGRASVSGP